MANVLKLWKGAVQPARTSPSGNEIKLWKGAVQPSNYGTIPDVVDTSQASAEAAIVAAGFVVGAETTAYSDTIAVGNVISQDPASGAGTLDSSVDLVISLGAEPSDEQQNSGGWGAQNWFDSYLQKRDRRRKERRRRLEETQDLEGIDREIARLLHKQLAREAREAEIESLEQMVSSTYSKAQEAQANLYNERVAKAYASAAAQASFSALERFEREMERAREEEEFLFLAMVMLD